MHRRLPPRPEDGVVPGLWQDRRRDRRMAQAHTVPPKPARTGTHAAPSEVRTAPAIGKRMNRSTITIHDPRTRLLAVFHLADGSQ